MFSILHISDLHRSSTEPVDNDALLASLVTDAQRYLLETPSIPPPQAVIVSGDLIQGVPLDRKAVDSNIWRGEIARQYAVAEDLLARVADRFLGGDRSQLVMVPGNHDTCWNTAFRSMAAVRADEIKNGILWELSQVDSPYRWSWQELKPYRVVDADAYARRLDTYWAFVERFYAGFRLPRPIDRSAGYNLFEMDKGRIIVAAFDSIAGNDCFSSSGALARDAVARCAMELLDSGRSYDLRIAIWHHSIDGPPRSVDYMDVSHVHEMIGHGFRLGLHGHQHVAAAAAHYIHLPESQAMAVISAGSLCAGARELPRGVNRQYNVVVLSDDRLSARLNVRQLSEGGHFARKMDGRFAAEGSILLEWQRPLDLGGRPIEADVRRRRSAIETAERMRAVGDIGGALQSLESLDLPAESFERALAMNIAVDAGRWDKVAAITAKPANAGELVHLVMALVRERRPDEAEQALTANAEIELPPPVLRDLRGQIATFRTLEPR